MFVVHLGRFAMGLAILWGLAAAGAVKAEDPVVILRGYGLTSDTSFQEGVHAISLLHGKVGFGLDAEVRPTEHLGVDLAFSDLRIAVKTVQVIDEGPQTIIEQRGGIHMMPLVLGVFVHPVRLSWMDLYFGPVGGWVFYNGDLGTATNSGQALGATLGLDVPSPARGWAAGANLRYLRVQFPDPDFGREPHNILQAAVGLSYRW
jgi:hypothetical protein